MPKKVQKSFNIGAVVHVWTSLPIVAESLEDAVVQARKLAVTDFVDVTGEHNDSELEIVGIDVRDWKMS